MPRRSEDLIAIKDLIIEGKVQSWLRIFPRDQDVLKVDSWVLYNAVTPFGKDLSADINIYTRIRGSIVKFSHRIPLSYPPTHLQFICDSQFTTLANLQIVLKSFTVLCRISLRNETYVRVYASFSMDAFIVSLLIEESIWVGERCRG